MKYQKRLLLSLYSSLPFVLGFGIFALTQVGFPAIMFALFGLVGGLSLLIHRAMKQPKSIVISDRGLTLAYVNSHKNAFVPFSLVTKIDY